MSLATNRGTFLIRASAREEITNAITFPDFGARSGFNCKLSNPEADNHPSATTNHHLLRSAALRPQLRTVASTGRSREVAL